METSTDCIAIDGELTVFTVEAWKDRLARALDASQALTVDLAAVTECDSAGLQLLAVLKREADLRGRDVALRNAAPAVAEVLALYRVRTLFGAPQ